MACYLPGHTMLPEVPLERDADDVLLEDLETLEPYLNLARNHSREASG